MKKHAFFALVALALVSCKMETPAAEEISSTDGMENTGVVTLTAALPQMKTNVDSNGKVTWTSNDEIAVYNTAGQMFRFTLSEGAGTSYATFSCAGFEGELGSVAVYPYSLAGTAPGTITFPANMPLTTEPQPVMASAITPGENGLEAGSLYFQHLMGMVEFSLRDIPAYACAFKLWCDGAQLKGDFSFDPAAIVPIAAPAEVDANDSYAFVFPYKTGYGAQTVTKFYAPLPVKNYGTNLKIRMLDGDGDVIENTGKTVSAAYSDITAGKYVAMPEINVRTLVGTARDKFTKVQKVKWAKSNLRAWANEGGAENKAGWQDDAVTDGFQKDWGLYANPWDSQFSIKGADGKMDGSSQAFTMNNSTYRTGNTWGGADYYSHFDYFSWGTIGRASRVHNTKVTCSVAEFVISGKVFQGSAATGGDIAAMTELEGDDRFTNKSLLDGSNSNMFGDLAFWASKGQYRMPTKEEIGTLYTKSDRLVKGCTNIQAGYYMDGNRKIFGILCTTVPFYTEGRIPSFNATAVELSLADIESGLFLPKAGERTTNQDNTYNATDIKNFNSWGVYWCGTFGGRNGSGFDDCARVIAWIGGNTTNYGYTVTLSHSIVGNTAIGNCIRPVLVD